jgi:hypothetical protein
LLETRARLGRVHAPHVRCSLDRYGFLCAAAKEAKCHFRTDAAQQSRGLVGARKQCRLILPPQKTEKRKGAFPLRMAIE